MKKLRVGKLSILALIGVLCVAPIGASAGGEENYNVSKKAEEYGQEQTVMMNVHKNYIYINGMKIKVKADTARGKFLAEVLSKVGSPYAWGAEGEPWTGKLVTAYGSPVTWDDLNFDYERCIGKPSYDCSGLVKEGLDEVGVKVPHYSGGQCSTKYGGTVVDISNGIEELQAGDIAGDGNHVVVYIGDGYIIEAPYTGASVRIISMEERFGGEKFPDSYTCVRYFNG